MHYNYLRPHTSLNDKTPAEAAGVDFPYKNWADITKHKPSKPVVIEHKPRGSYRLEPTHVGRPKKRVRVKTPKIPDTLSAGGGIEYSKRTGRGHIKL